MFRKALFFVGVALMLVPVLVFAGNSSTSAPSIFTIVTGFFGVGLLGSIGIIFKLKKAIKEVGEFVVVIKERVTDKVVLAEADEALEAIADVLASVKQNNLAEKLRKVL